MDSVTTTGLTPRGLAHRLRRQLLEAVARGTTVLMAAAFGMPGLVQAQTSVLVGPGPGCAFSSMEGALSGTDLSTEVTFKVFDDGLPIPLAKALLVKEAKGVSIVGGHVGPECREGVPSTRKTVFLTPPAEPVLAFRGHCSRPSSYHLRNVEIRGSGGQLYPAAGGGVALFACKDGAPQPELTMENVSVAGTRAGWGGGVSVFNAHLKLRDVSILDAQALGTLGSSGHFENGHGGGLACQRGSVTFLGGQNEVNDNRADGFGGGIFAMHCSVSTGAADGALTIARNKLNARFVKGDSGGMRSKGGGIHVYSAALQLGGASFPVDIVGNATALLPTGAVDGGFDGYLSERPSGGAVSAEDADIVLSNALVEGNWATDGAVLHNWSGNSLTVLDTTLRGNTSWGWIDNGGLFGSANGHSGGPVIVSTGGAIRVERSRIVGNRMMCRPAGGVLKSNCTADTSMLDLAGAAGEGSLDSVLIAGNGAEEGGSAEDWVHVFLRVSQGAVVSNLTMVDNYFANDSGRPVIPLACRNGCEVRNSLLLPRSPTIAPLLWVNSPTDRVSRFNCVRTTEVMLGDIVRENISRNDTGAVSSTVLDSLFLAPTYRLNPQVAEDLFDRCASGGTGASSRDVDGMPRAVDLPDVVNTTAGFVDLGAYERQAAPSQQAALIDIKQVIGQTPTTLGQSYISSTQLSVTREGGSTVPVRTKATIRLLPVPGAADLASRFTSGTPGCKLDEVSPQVMTCEKDIAGIGGFGYALLLLDDDILVDVRVETVDGTAVATGSKTTAQDTLSVPGFPGDVAPELAGPVSVATGPQRLTYTARFRVDGVSLTQLPQTWVYRVAPDGLPVEPPSGCSSDANGWFCTMSFALGWSEVRDGSGNVTGYRSKQSAAITWDVDVKDPALDSEAPSSFIVRLAVADSFPENNTATQVTVVESSAAADLGLTLPLSLSAGADAVGHVARRGVDTETNMDVALASSVAALTVPASVVIPMGQTSVTFSIKVTPGAVPGNVTVSAEAPGLAPAAGDIRITSSEVFSSGFEGD